jgi:hypothetical protein
MYGALPVFGRGGVSANDFKGPSSGLAFSDPAAGNGGLIAAMSDCDSGKRRSHMSLHDSALRVSGL